MPESESEDEILDRIEVALRKIATVAQAPKPADGREIDRVALAKSLDMLISRLRNGLEAPKSAEQITGVIAMAQVTIRINGYAYIVGCEDGQEAHLERMAAEIEQRINSIKAIGGQSGEARLLMLAALLLADELHDTRTNTAAHPPPNRSRARRMRNGAPNCAGSPRARKRLQRTSQTPK